MMFYDNMVVFTFSPFENSCCEDSKIVFLAGGKWTTYREMAQDAVDKVRQDVCYLCHVCMRLVKIIQLHGKLIYYILNS